MAIAIVPVAMLRIANPRFKLPTHIVQIIVTVIVMILAGVRLTTLTRTAPRTRTNSMALGMASFFYHITPTYSYRTTSNTKE